MKVKLNKKYATSKFKNDFSIDKEYPVIGIEANDYRIINDNGFPYLYPNSIFIITDKTEPQDWITDYGDDGERYSYPQSLNQPGFFEDYFDRDRKAIEIFKNYKGEKGSGL